MCNMNWGGVRSSALSPHDAGTHWRAHFASSPTANCVFSDDFFQSLSLRFAALTSSHESGRFDAPFSHNELVAALSRCHESSPGADGLPYSAFKVSFPWWRHLLLSFFNLILRFAVVPSAWKSSLVVPLLKRDGDPAFFDSYRPISLASCAFKVFEHLVHARIAPHISPQLDVSQGGFRWGADTLVCSLVDSLRLRHQVHTFVAFIDIRKAFDSCWVEATLVRLGDVGISGRLWHLLANFLCGTLSQVRLGDSTSQPWVDSGVAQGRVPLTSPVQFAGGQPCHLSPCRLVDSDPFRDVCQLYADDLPPCGIPGPSSGCFGRRACVGSSLAVLVWYWPHSLPLWCHNTGTSVSLLPLLSLGVLTLTWSALVVIASSTKLAPGVVAKVCPSLSPHLSSLLTSFPVRHLVSTSATQLLAPSLVPPSSWVAQCFSCRSSSLGVWHWRCTPPCSRTCILFVWSLVCHGPLFLSPSRPCQWSSGSVRPCKAHGRIGARPLFDLFQSHILATLAFLWVPSFGRPTLVLSRSQTPLDRDLLAAMASDLHGVRDDVSDNFLPARENPVYSFNLPPSAVRLWGLARWGHDLSSTGRPPAIGLGLPLALSAMMWMVLSYITSPLAPPTSINARAAWAHSCGVSRSDVPAFARHGWVFNPLDESNTPQDNPGPHSLCRARL